MTPTRAVAATDTDERRGMTPMRAVAATDTNESHRLTLMRATAGADESHGMTSQEGDARGRSRRRRN